MKVLIIQKIKVKIKEQKKKHQKIKIKKIIKNIQKKK